VVFLLAGVKYRKFISRPGRRFKSIAKFKRAVPQLKPESLTKRKLSGKKKQGFFCP
jgi:hypothetical protein